MIALAAALAGLVFFEGDWHCRSTRGAPTESKLHVERRSDHLTLLFETSGAASLRSLEEIHVDPATGEILYAWLPGRGSARSPGWRGQALVWLGDFLGGRVRQTWTRRGASEFSYKLERARGALWSTEGEGACKR